MKKSVHDQKKIQSNIDRLCGKTWSEVADAFEREMAYLRERAGMRPNQYWTDKIPY